tara:strand:+ start:20792 stop:21169 length:378 start_codon:yes stop_codon:yes gene_type:complete
MTKLITDVTELPLETLLRIQDDHIAGEGHSTIRFGYGVSYGVINEIINETRSPDTKLFHAVTRARRNLPTITCTQGVSRKWFIYVYDDERSVSFKTTGASFDQALDFLAAIARGANLEEAKKYTI